MSNKSPFFVESKPLTRQDVLRERLDRLESLIGRLEKVGLDGEALQALELFDQAREVLQELERNGTPVPEEAIRFESVGARLKAKASPFLRSMGGAKALRKARQAINPGAERWWWFLDQYLADLRHQQARSLMLRLAITLAVLALLAGVYRLFLAPSPQEQARFAHEGAAERMMMEGNLEGALAEAEKALALAPEDAELLLMKGVILQTLGRQAQADQVFAQADTVLGDRLEFLVLRGQKFLNAGNYDAGLADAQTAIQINPQSPEAYLLLGQAHELLEHYAEAMAAYERAGKLADQQSRPELTALARVRLAYLMQRIP